MIERDDNRRRNDIVSARRLTQRDFRSEPGAYHLTCHSCTVDAHLIRWGEFTQDEDPICCPYCGSEDIWLAPERHR